jgi:polar amino acid transport system substrate-binding protein
VLRNDALKPKTLSLYALVFIVFNTAVGAETLKVCYDQWPPMTIFPNLNESRRGVVIDMFSDIYKNAGISLEFFEVPYARGMQMVADGLCDVLPEKEFSPIGEQGYVYAQQETFQYSTAFVVRRDDPWRYNGIQSIDGKRVATGPGWNYSSMSKAYQSYLNDPANQNLIEIVAGESDVVDRILRMIVAGRVDIYADNVFVLEYLINTNNLSKKLKVVRPGLEHKLIEKPIFSSKLDPEKRDRLIKIWNTGRESITPQEEATLLKGYGIELEQADEDFILSN